LVIIGLVILSIGLKNKGRDVRARGEGTACCLYAGRKRGCGVGENGRLKAGIQSSNSNADSKGRKQKISCKLGMESRVLSVTGIRQGREQEKEFQR